MVVEVKSRVLDPHWWCDTKRHLDETSPQGRRAVKSSRHEGTHLVKGEAPGRSRRVDEEHTGHVHVIRGCLHVKEHGVEPAQPLHCISLFASPTAMTETSLATFARLEALHCHEKGLLHSTDHQLGDPVPAVDLVGAVRICVHKYDRDLAAVTRVDQAGCIEASDAVLGGEAAPRQHQTRMTIWDLEPDPGRDGRATTGRGENRTVPGNQVATRVAEPRVARQRKGLVEANQWNLEHDSAP